MFIYEAFIIQMCLKIWDQQNNPQGLHYILKNKHIKVCPTQYLFLKV